jgi:hypothetical protein
LIKLALRYKVFAKQDTASASSYAFKGLCTCGTPTALGNQAPFLLGRKNT